MIFFYLKQIYLRFINENHMIQKIKLAVTDWLSLQST